ncbi:MAG TPA: ATP-dependent RecD-like DNA helicase [Clostridiales bacterium]|jgi:exodeoxyribonuclease V alpha subunit|nr:ATP-dependent RecD-like DNA helicase [Clostridiales bacterium]HPP68799.1 ATP-dependent RecD-like DNA helicase [Clostridiales bacterium]HPU67989.1 ATP-dependent RecD-like DNA helicase [Clostridiales bacterium]HQD72152.1 ATP-dependent RecD-like DNA helicase [Clostridiales bacterium]HXK83761.1 ATP-dependent RecD-like DNA helicase [Clostridiales bacterium]
MYSQDYKEKISGIVDRVVFRNEENSFTVIELNCGGELVTAVGSLPELSSGEEISLYGTWDSHTLFGRQFKASQIERKMPETASQLLRYLSAGTIKGIGAKTALKIIEQFGENSFKVLSEEPERLTQIRGISLEKARRISDEYNSQMAIRTVMIALEGYGLKAHECIEIFKILGPSAVAAVENNPYILCSILSGFTFERAEEIAAKLPEKPDNKHRLRAGIEFILRHNLGNGHTCVPYDKIVSLSATYLNEGTDAIEIAIDEMLENQLLYSAEIDGRLFIFLPEMYRAERKAAERLLALMKFSPGSVGALREEIESIETAVGISYGELQKKALETAAMKGVMILTGGPGTGKTTTLKGIISLFKKRGLHIALAAPTGRAAKRMTEVTGMEAKTIHRLLEVEWGDGERPVFRRDLQNPIDADAIIVDELSMVDISLFSNLLEAVPFGCRLILVGDSDQLPPVGAGNVLHDLIDSGLIPVIKLNQVFRQAEKSRIVTNAHRIIRGEMPEISNEGDFFFLERKSADLAARTVRELCCERLPDAYGISPIEDLQVLCPSRNGVCGTANLNRLLQERLNPRDLSKAEIKSGGFVFREGDKVMQTKNNYNLEWTSGFSEGTGVFNGDLGVIKKIKPAEGVLVIDFDGKEVLYPAEKLSDLELAYAITVHKSQGSEYDTVILPIIDSSAKLLYRNLLYTAVTRAKRMIVIVGLKSKLEAMVNNDKQSKRYSALKSFIENGVLI